MTSNIPINPDVLHWARKTAGLSANEVAGRLRRKSITDETIAEWERGKGSPTYSQLEQLAYDIYKRPLAIFFFPEPPKEETPRQSFRTLPEQEIQHLSPRLRYLLRYARAMQINLAELFDGINTADKQIVRDLQFAPGVSVSKMANSVRDFLDINLNTQFDWTTPDQAFKAWRDVLETHGIFVFKDAFKDDGVSGFCLYDSTFPIIFINNSKPGTRQIFTLFHELSHLLLGTGGIDTRLDDYIELLHGDDKLVEVLCNQFSGNFLVPDEDFDKRIIDMIFNEDNISILAYQYVVSREVILRKLFDRQLVNQSVYDECSAKWASEARQGGGEGGNYYLTKGAYLGQRYLELTFSRYYQNRITIDQLANYLGVKVKSVPGMEALLFRKGTAA